MAATAAQIERLRRMCGLTSSDVTYTDAALAGYIERHPLPDEWGELPYYQDNSTTPPTQETNENWASSYDLAAAAADVWDEKAAGYATQYDVTTDGATRNLSQQYAQAQKQARYWRSRRAMVSVRVSTVPREEREYESDFQ